MQIINIVVLGAAGVGKTSFIQNIIGNIFNGIYRPTSYFNSITYTNSGKQYIFHDISGQEISSMIPTVQQLVQAADLVIIMFDKTSMISFKQVNNFYNCFGSSTANIPFILCGSKSDINNPKVVSANVVSIYPLIPYFEISSKTSNKINTLMQYIHQY